MMINDAWPKNPSQGAWMSEKSRKIHVGMVKSMRFKIPGMDREIHPALGRCACFASICPLGWSQAVLTSKALCLGEYLIAIPLGEYSHCLGEVYDSTSLSFLEDMGDDR